MPQSVAGRLRKQVTPLSPVAKVISDFSPVFQKHCFDAAAPTRSRREPTLRSIGVFNIGPAFQACERTIL
jgi:hypothetical protein